jgi:hypothetical protein
MTSWADRVTARSIPLTSAAMMIEIGSMMGTSVRATDDLRLVRVGSSGLIRKGGALHPPSSAWYAGGRAGRIRPAWTGGTR